MVRRRVVFLAAVLCIISLPLIYTLRLSVVELGLKKKIQIVLKTRFDQTGISRLATFTHSEAPDRRIVIDAVINTTRYLSEKEISLAEQEMVRTLRRPVVFHLEQVKVQPGGLKEEVQAKSFVTPQVKKQRPHAEIVTEARNELMRLSEGVAEKINAVISPSTVRDFSVGIPRRDSNLSLTLTIGRDHPLSKDELRILEKMISGEFGVPVLLRVETVPFIPPLLFSDGEVTISEEMKRSLLVAGKVIGGDPVMTITVASRPAFPATRNRNRHAAERAASVTSFLKESHAVPDERIRTVTLPAEKGADPAVTVRILPGNE